MRRELCGTWDFPDAFVLDQAAFAQARAALRGPLGHVDPDTSDAARRPDWSHQEAHRVEIWTWLQLSSQPMRVRGGASCLSRSQDNRRLRNIEGRHVPDCRMTCSEARARE